MARHYIDVWCASCDRKVTLEEVATDYHSDHSFEPMELAAMQAVTQFMKSPAIVRLH
jgi:hypothetical protein